MIRVVATGSVRRKRPSRCFTSASSSEKFAMFAVMYRVLSVVRCRTWSGCSCAVGAAGSNGFLRKVTSSSIGRNTGIPHTDDPDALAKAFGASRAFACKRCGGDDVVPYFCLRSQDTCWIARDATEGPGVYRLVAGGRLRRSTRGRRVAHSVRARRCDACLMPVPDQPEGTEGSGHRFVNRRSRRSRLR